jgi:4Fe-4S ferredoxin
VFRGIRVPEHGADARRASLTNPSESQEGVDAKNENACKGEPGRVAPIVDRNKCEGKEDCVTVCPYDVFEIGTLAPEDRSALSIIGRVKAWAHGGKQAFVVKPDACHACQLCVAACPENALSLAALRA